MAASVAPHQRHLRIALLFGENLEAEEVLMEPKPVVLGSHHDALLPLPLGAVEEDRVELMRPGAQGYELALHPAMSGAVWLGGERKEVESLRGERVPLGPDDYGVLTLGGVAFFFQMVRPAGRIGRGFPVLLRDPALLLALLLSLFLHGAFAVLLVFALAFTPEPDPFELPPDFVRRFIAVAPPELSELELALAESGGDGDAIGIRERDEVGGGEAAQGLEGRAGREDARAERTQLEGPAGGSAAERVRNLGTLGAIRGGEGEASALDAALGALNVADMLGGMDSSNTVIGAGTGGLGLRGSGRGGGGDGPGVLYGAGQLGTGVGAGRGAGRGGSGGRGSGAGAGRGSARQEVRVTMTTAPPRVSGYLSPEQIMRVVRRNQAAVRYCYENELQRQPSLRGRIEIQWRIARNGSVSSARVGSSTMRNAKVEGCIVRQVRRWRFDAPDGGEVAVTFPFIFGTGG